MPLSEGPISFGESDPTSEINQTPRPVSEQPSSEPVTIEESSFPFYPSVSFKLPHELTI